MMFFNKNTKYRVIIVTVILVIFGFALACSGYSETKEEVDEIRDDLEEIESSHADTKEKELKGEEKTETGLNKEAEYKLSASNLITRIGDHIVLIGEVTDDYNYGEITLENFKEYLGDFIMMFKESYCPDYLNLEPPVECEDHYKYIGRFMEHIGKSTEYFQNAIDSEDEDRMLYNMDKALLEIEKGNEWLEKANKNMNNYKN